METKKTTTWQDTTGKVAVLFEVKPKAEGKEEYLKLAAALKAELMKMPGFNNILTGFLLICPKYHRL